MKKIILGTLLGLTFVAAGLVIALVLFEGVLARNPLFLIASILLIFIGMGVLFYTGIKNASMKFRLKEVDVSNAGETLEKNNEMIKEWSDTTKKREKLKMLSVAGEELTDSPS